MRWNAMMALVTAALALPVLETPTPAAAAPPGCAPATPAAVAELFDARVPPLIGNATIPGAVVSVVAGGQTVFAKGYGLADVHSGAPMDATATPVRIASITKLFTFTAVMQQVQAGRLDLGADVNTYLDFRIPATYPRPITVLDLLDHTAGFEDRIIGPGARSAADVPPLGDYLKANIPARIRPPGEASAYSNYGAALAGYLVERVTGEPYAQYIQRHLLDPLGMAHSSAVEPPPFAPARSYNTDETPPREVPFTFDPMTPDGSISASAADMAAFMRADLDPGNATAALMHQRSFAFDPRLGGYAHGFMDRTMNGRRVLMHDGSWEAFGSALLLVPECSLGLFVSFSSTAAANGFDATVQPFLDRFAPRVDPAAVSGPATGAPAPGFYAPTRHNESTMERLLMLLGPMRLTVDGDGTVHFKGKAWHDAGGGLYRAQDGDDHLVARGRYVGTDGPTYERMSLTDGLFFNLAVLGAFLLISLTIPVYLALRLFRRSPSSPAWRAARWLTGAAAALGVTFLVLLVLTLAGNVSDFIYDAPARFRLLMLVPLLALAAGVLGIAGTVRGWSSARRGARIHQVASLAGLAALTWFLWNWNLIGWQF